MPIINEDERRVLEGRRLRELVRSDGTTALVEATDRLSDRALGLLVKLVNACRR